MMDSNENQSDLDGNFRKLSLQVLSLVEDRLHKAFSSSTPIEIPNLQPTSVKRCGGGGGLQPIEKTPAVLSTSPPTTLDADQLPTYSLNEVSYHETRDDCWIIMYDRVYDLTSFVFEHPGGEDVLLEYAGRDCTIPFRSVGHSKIAEMSLEPYLIGILPDHERLWSKIF